MCCGAAFSQWRNRSRSGPRSSASVCAKMQVAPAAHTRPAAMCRQMICLLIDGSEAERAWYIVRVPP